MSDPTRLRDRISAAFADVPKPPRDLIAPHQCEECEEIRRDLADWDIQNVPQEMLEEHRQTLPMLGPEALRYFLPAYLRYAISSPDSEVMEYVLYHLSPKNHELKEDYWKERFNSFTDEQKEATLDFLIWASRVVNLELFESDVRRAIRVWSRTA